MNNISALFRKLGMGMLIWLYLLNPGNSYSQAISPPYDLSVIFDNDLIPIVELIWQHNTDAFLFYLVERDGDSVGTATIPFYSESVPCFCTYCYRVYAVYDNGISEPCAPDCTFDSVALMTISPDQLEVWLFPDEASTTILNIDNIGGEPLQYTFPDFIGGTPPPGFISDVNPATAFLPPGVGADVTVSFDASGYSSGTYYQYLIIESNDPYWLYDSIPCIMHVYTPAYVGGVVTDSITSQPINGAIVTVGIWQTYTIYDGSYLLEVDEGTYDINYEKLAYHPVLVAGTFIPGGDTTIQNVSLLPVSYPVPWVLAENICNEPSPTDVSWDYPGGLFEIIYDDGTAEDLFCWTLADGENAVRFTPAGNPARILGASIYAGDGSFPTGNWIGTQFSVLLYDEDINGLPGTILDSMIVTVNNYEWINCWGFNTIIDSGDFFISMKQLNPSPNTAPLGIDMDPPIVNRSYSKIPGGSWSISVYQDFMIRAFLNEPTAIPVDYFTIARISDFDPDLGPQTGTITILSTTNSLSYTDNQFQTLGGGWYAYAVQTAYVSGETSPWAYSNIVGMDMGKVVDFQFEDCNGLPVDSVEVTLEGEDWPYAVFPEHPDSVLQNHFDCVWKGCYSITIIKPGFEQININSCIYSDTTFIVTINPIAYLPRNLWVDSLSSTAYWEAPLVTILSEDFEGPSLPSGWQMTTAGYGWYLTYNGSSTNFTIPPWNSQYMCSNEDECPTGSGNDGMVDYLITPPMDLRETVLYHLEFDSYFTGAYGSMASVEYSYNNGTNWTVLHTLIPGPPDYWEKIDVDLSGISGSGSIYPVWLAFHSNDGGSWATGWAVDNPEIIAGPANPVNYHVFLDSAFMAETDTTFYQYYELTYGQIYTACVAANYECGLSDQVCVDFTSGYLRAPGWIEGDTSGQNIVLHWWMDTLGIVDDILGYNVYRDSINIDYVPYTGEDTAYYTDVEPDPMCYDYYISTIHDLTKYGLPGDTGESSKLGPEEVCLVYGTFLPFGEDWSSGSFGSFWTPEQNWVINGQYGNPEPCAEFTWDPILTNYQQSLTSGYINGVYQEAKDGPYIDGRFILEFDVSLDDYSVSGNEYFAVEVWSNGIWQRVKLFSNADGDFDWTNVEIDISDEAFGYVFKIRFMAEGALSSDILSWFVDNVNIYRICYPPTDLVVQGKDPYTMELYWSPPFTGGGVSEWIMWDDGVNIDGIGLTGGGVFSVASHWNPDMISQFYGQYITKIRFVPYINAVTTNFTLKVWQGPNAATMIYEEAVSGLLLGNWNEITLTSAVAIDVTKELWFGYTCDSPDGENPAGFDAGPGVVGYGDMITLDGIIWDPIANFGFDLNWNIHALVDNATDHPLVQMMHNEDLSVYNTPAGLPVESEGETSYNPIGLSVQAITGYRIYFNDDGAGYEYIGLTQDTFYSHVKEPPFQPDGLYCYYVKAVYEDCDADSDEACWLHSGIDYYGIENSILVFPNPSNDLINIESKIAISQLCILDYSGR
ncbi:MAG: choice-of-anchor J domain-containing protein, partial [Bacteroidales bacterium]|nr:choice-of-anchor J domain-containing protein [Bacteroidales bacterium]